MDGSLDTNIKKNVVSASRPAGAGLWCVLLDSSIDATKTGATVSPYFPLDSTTIGASAVTVHAEYNSPGGSGCTGNNIGVVTYTRNSAGATTLSNQPFFIAVP